MTNKPITSPGIVNTVRYLFKEIKLACNSVMTIENSPLKNLDPMAAHVVFQSLAFVWSAIFASMLGSMMAFGISAVFHILLISGIVITAMAFREANKNPEAFNKLLSSGRKYNGRAADGEHI